MQSLYTCRMRFMEVVLLNQDYPTYIFGGVGTFMHELAKGLARRGLKVHVITGYNVPLSSLGHFRFRRKTEDSVDVQRFPYPNIVPRHTVFQVWNFKKLSESIRSLDVDVIHGQCTATYPLMRVLRKKAPILVTFHTSPMMEKIGSAQSVLRGGSLSDIWTYLIGYPAYHFTFLKELQYSDAVITVSKSLKSEILLEMGEKYAEKIQCIYNGIDLKSLDDEYEEVEEEFPESEKTILFAGRLFWRKGALSLVKLAYILQKKNTSFKIIVHGTGPLFGRMQKLIRSLSLKNIELKGFTAKSQLLKSMRRSKFVAIPSTYEACPMILLESMCLGKIPLMLKLPFSCELTEEGKYGILGDGMTNIANQLMTFEDNHSLSRLSKDIQTFARNKYNIENLASKYIEAYHNLSS
jgi:glycosyltransferase involved in cell wall biosynthesis